MLLTNTQRHIKKKPLESIFDLVNCHWIVYIRFCCVQSFTSWGQFIHLGKQIAFFITLFAGANYDLNIVIQFVRLVAPFTRLEKVVNYNRKVQATKFINNEASINGVHQLNDEIKNILAE